MSAKDYINLKSLNKSGNDLVIVSGVPRSGTSLSMSILKDMGLNPFYKDKKIPQAFKMNPKGFYESQFVFKGLRSNPDLDIIKNFYSVKILLQNLNLSLNTLKTANRNYKIVFCLRDPLEIITSHRTYFKSMEGRPIKSTAATILSGWIKFFSLQDEFKNIFVMDYNKLLRDPDKVLSKLSVFLNLNLDNAQIHKISSECVDPKLHRSVGISIDRETDKYLWKFHEMIRKKFIDENVISDVKKFISENGVQPTLPLKRQGAGIIIENELDQEKVDKLAKSVKAKFNSKAGSTDKPKALLLSLASKNWPKAKTRGFQGSFIDWINTINSISI